MAICMLRATRDYQKTTQVLKHLMICYYVALAFTADAVSTPKLVVVAMEIAETASAYTESNVVHLVADRVNWWTLRPIPIDPIGGFCRKLPMTRFAVLDYDLDPTMEVGHRLSAGDGSIDGMALRGRRCKVSEAIA